MFLEYKVDRLYFKILVQIANFHSLIKNEQIFISVRNIFSILLNVKLKIFSTV